MESKTNYTIVGLVVIALTAALIASLIWLSSGLDMTNYKNYIVYINESVHGLSEESPVKFNGLKVGVIDEIMLDESNPQRVKLLLKIDSDTPITIGTRATIISQGITGANFLGLRAISASLEPLPKPANEPYPVIPYTLSFFGQVENNISSITYDLKQIMDPENARLLKQSLRHLDESLKPFAKNSENINKLLQELPKAIVDIRNSAREFKSMSHHISIASGQFSETMKAGKLSIEQFNQQTLPTANAFLRRLDVITSNLEQTTSLIKQNPAVILRGNATPSSGPGE